MKNKNTSSRRKFLKKLSASSAALALGTKALAENQEKYVETLFRAPFSANDQVNIALIGAGIMGGEDTRTALSVPGTKLVAVCDLYDGRLKEAKSKWGNDIFTTRSYKELLNRADIDAVIIATSDHWHQQISIDSMKEGKHVY